MNNGNWEVVSTYTNQNALDDGIFVDVTESARLYGFICKFLVTAGVLQHFSSDMEKLGAVIEAFTQKIIQEPKFDGNLVILAHEGTTYWMIYEQDPELGHLVKLMLPEEY